MRAKDESNPRHSRVLPDAQGSEAAEAGGRSPPHGSAAAVAAVAPLGVDQGSGAEAGAAESEVSTRLKRLPDSAGRPREGCKNGEANEGKVTSNQMPVFQSALRCRQKTRSEGK